MINMNTSKKNESSYLAKEKAASMNGAMNESMRGNVEAREKSSRIIKAAGLKYSKALNNLAKR